MDDTKPIYMSILERQIELSIKAKLVKVLRDDTAQALAVITDHQYEYDSIIKTVANEYLVDGLSLSEAVNKINTSIDDAKKEEASDG